MGTYRPSREDYRVGDIKCCKGILGQTQQILEGFPKTVFNLSLVSVVV
jgi:hypothetical protein